MFGKKAVVPMIAMLSSIFNPENLIGEIYGKPVFNNSQKIITKPCGKCGKPFKTQRINGFMNCRKCNGEE